MKFFPFLVAALAETSVFASVLLVKDTATVGVDEARDILAKIDAGEPALVVGGPFMSNRTVRWSPFF